MRCTQPPPTSFTLLLPTENGGVSSEEVSSRHPSRRGSGGRSPPSSRPWEPNGLPRTRTRARRLARSWRSRIRSHAHPSSRPARCWTCGPSPQKIDVVALRGPHARHLVRRDGHPQPGPTTQDGPLVLTPGDGLGHLDRDIGLVGGGPQGQCRSLLPRNRYL